MKICFIAPGEISIPPDGWGALESVVWNLSRELIKLGHNVLIINETDINKTLNIAKSFDPDILHLHYGKHFEIMPYFSCRKIVTNYDGSFENSFQFHNRITRNFFYDCEFFCFRNYEKKFFLNIGISPNKIKLLPLAIPFSEKYKKKITKPINYDKSIYLGKIDWRKRQYLFQNKNLNIDFVGPNYDPRFNTNDPEYLGTWTEEEKFNKLTDYANLVLLSISENGNPPLVCLEAMWAGLGIVISETCNEGLDTSKNFISIIPDEKIKDFNYIKKIISDNRKYSIENRKEIIDYVSNRTYTNLGLIYNKYLWKN